MSFNDHLDKMKAIHEKKRKDYAGESNPFENFERAAMVSSWFTNPVDCVFATLITVKMARLATLLNSGAVPNNESTDDSFLDGNNYWNLWWTWREQQKVSSPRINMEDAYNKAIESLRKNLQSDLPK